MKTITFKWATICLLFLLMSTSEIFAQQLNAGPKIGINRSNFNNASSASAREDVNFGFFVEYSKWKHWGISGDLLLTGKGAENESVIKNTNVFQRWNTSTELNYIEIPVQAVFYIHHDTNAFRPKITFGPTFSFLVDANQRTEYLLINSQENITSYSVTYKDLSSRTYNTFDLGASVGTGFNYRIMGDTWINFDVKYNFGLLDIYNSGNIDIKNRNLSIMLGLGLPLSSPKK